MAGFVFHEIIDSPRIRWRYAGVLQDGNGYKELYAASPIISSHRDSHILTFQRWFIRRFWAKNSFHIQHTLISGAV